MKGFYLVKLSVVFMVVCAVAGLISCQTEASYQSPDPNYTPPTRTPIPTATAIPASEAKKHVGERTTVYGIVASTNYATGSKGKPTFLNLDKPYPNQVFTVLIWDNNRRNFPNSPEVFYKGKTIYVTGLIISYQGVPEIEVTNPSQIQVR